MYLEPIAWNSHLNIERASAITVQHVKLSGNCKNILTDDISASFPLASRVWILKRSRWPSDTKICTFYNMWVVCSRLIMRAQSCFDIYHYLCWVASGFWSSSGAPMNIYMHATTSSCFLHESYATCTKSTFAHQIWRASCIMHFWKLLSIDHTYGVSIHSLLYLNANAGLLRLDSWREFRTCATGPVFKHFHSNSTIVWSATNTAPTSTCNDLTTHSVSARKTFCIFIASTTATSSPGKTLLPTSTSNEIRFPGIGDRRICTPHHTPHHRPSSSQNTHASLKLMHNQNSQLHIVCSEEPRNISMLAYTQERKTCSIFEKSAVLVRRTHNDIHNIALLWTCPVSLCEASISATKPEWKSQQRPSAALPCR